MAQMVFGPGLVVACSPRVNGRWATPTSSGAGRWPPRSPTSPSGPAILAYRCWGMGVQRVGPNVAGFFANLTPLFAAVLSAAFLGELPRLYHALAFVLIVGGIVVSSRR